MDPGNRQGKGPLIHSSKNPRLKKMWCVGILCPFLVVFACPFRHFAYLFGHFISLCGCFVSLYLFFVILFIGFVTLFGSFGLLYGSFMFHSETFYR